jgi:hypothetical protein
VQADEIERHMLDRQVREQRRDVEARAQDADALVAPE